MTRKAFSGICPRYSSLLKKCVVSFMNECVVCTSGLRRWPAVVKHVQYMAFAGNNGAARDTRLMYFG